MNAHTPGPLVVKPFDGIVEVSCPLALVDARGRATAYVLREADARLYAQAPRLWALVRAAFIDTAGPGDVAAQLEALAEEAWAAVRACEEHDGE